MSLLEQNEVWIDREGRLWPLVGMSPRHRRNLLNWLRRRATVLEWNDAMSHLTLWERMGIEDGWMMGDMVDDLAGRKPMEWLESTPLVQRLAALVHEDRCVDLGAWVDPSEPW